MAIASVSIRLELNTADAALAEGIAYAHELRHWPTIWTLVGYTAERLAATARPPCAAGVLAGYLEANQPHVVTLIERSAIAKARLPDLKGTEAQQGRADGAVMDRNRLVTYALSMLSAADELDRRR